jgi:hypothetical protein
MDPPRYVGLQAVKPHIERPRMLRIPISPQVRRRTRVVSCFGDGEMPLLRRRIPQLKAWVLTTSMCTFCSLLRFQWQYCVETQSARFGTVAGATLCTLGITRNCRLHFGRWPVARMEPSGQPGAYSRMPSSPLSPKDMRPSCSTVVARSSNGTIQSSPSAPPCCPNSAGERLRF